MYPTLKHLNILKQILKELKGKVDNNTIMVGNKYSILNNDWIIQIENQ